MYPLYEGLFAPRNQWYVAAWSSEVTREPIERTILDEPSTSAGAGGGCSRR